MGIRQHRQNRHVQHFRDISDKAYARNEQLALTTRPIAEHLAKQQARINRNSLEVDVREFYYFKRKMSGRICSCRLGGENAAQHSCLICYNTGYVGGYDKYGTKTEILDTTLPGITMVNMRPNTEQNTKPVFFCLEDGAKSGYVQAEFPLFRGSSWVDVISAYDNTSTFDGRAKLDLMCREKGTNTWLQFTSQTLSSILASNAQTLEVAVYLSRKSINVESPLFSHLLFRYGLLPMQKTKIKADIPKSNQSITMQEYGYEEQFGQLSMFFDGEVHGFMLNDVMYYLEERKFIGLTDVTPTKVFGTSLSWDITARFLQPFEAPTKLPI